MSERNYNRPTIMLIVHKTRVWLGVLLGFMVILGVIAIGLIKTEKLITSSSPRSLPVNSTAQSVTTPQFEVELVKPTISGENYFVNYRLKREQFRQETKAMLAELLNTNVEKSKVQAQERWLELSTKIQKEGELENLLKMKGFQDAVVEVSKDNVTVIIYAPSLSNNEISMIQDIVVRTANVRLDKISISSKK